jgi:hypothetical protein
LLDEGRASGLSGQLDMIRRHDGETNRKVDPSHRLWDDDGCCERGRFGISSERGSRDVRPGRERSPMHNSQDGSDQQSTQKCHLNIPSEAPRKNRNPLVLLRRRLPPLQQPHRASGCTSRKSSCYPEETCRLDERRLGRVSELSGRGQRKGEEEGGWQRDVEGVASGRLSGS